jgi:phosphonate C-P lyase system protein PhnG
MYLIMGRLKILENRVMEYTQICAEGDLTLLGGIAEYISDNANVHVVKKPSPAMVMVRHTDPLEKTPFHLGEAYVTECEVEVEGVIGYSCVLGQESERALYGALIDAVQSAKTELKNRVNLMLERVGKALEKKWESEAKEVSGTKVDFDVR